MRTGRRASLLVRGGAVGPWEAQEVDLEEIVLAYILGGPLLARELEQGTYRLAWTQGVSRRRWLAARVGALVLVCVVAGLVVGLVMDWYYRPFDRFDGGPFQSGRYSFASSPTPRTSCSPSPSPPARAR